MTQQTFQRRRVRSLSTRTLVSAACLVMAAQAWVPVLPSRSLPSPLHYSNDPAVLKSRPEGMTKPGVTRDEELEYSFRIRTLRAAMRLREQLVAQHANGMYVHPTEDQWATACGTSLPELRRILSEGQEARQALVSANVGLVTATAKRHYYALKQATEAGGGVGTILTLQDLVQEGNLGLMEAAERYEPEKGFRFSTYATWWIRQRILKAVSDSSRTIRLPAHVHSTLQKIKKAKAELKANLGRDPTSEELAQYCELSVKQLLKYTSSSRNVVSLESPLRSASFKEDHRTIGDTLASDAPTPEEDAEADSMRQDIRHVMETELATRERDVLVQRFGLEDGKPKTVEETSQALGISRDRVRLLEARALNKLRHPQRNFRLKEYVGAEDNESSLALTSDRLWFF